MVFIKSIVRMFLFCVCLYQNLKLIVLLVMSLLISRALDGLQQASKLRIWHR